MPNENEKTVVPIKIDGPVKYKRPIYTTDDDQRIQDNTHLRGESTKSLYRSMKAHLDIAARHRQETMRTFCSQSQRNPLLRAMGVDSPLSPNAARLEGETERLQYERTLKDVRSGKLVMIDEIGMPTAVGGEVIDRLTKEAEKAGGWVCTSPIQPCYKEQLKAVGDVCGCYGCMFEREEMDRMKEDLRKRMVALKRSRKEPDPYNLRGLGDQMLKEWFRAHGLIGPHSVRQR